MDTKALRQKILDLAIRGKLVPQDPTDEPASVLLERIRAEKQQMVKEGKLKPKDIKNDTVIFKADDNLHYEKFADGSVKCIEDEIPFELPEGWAWDRLGNVSTIARGGSPRPIDKFITDDEDGINWIKIGDTEKDGKYIQYTREKIKPEGLSKTRYVKSGDFLLTNSMSFGRPYILKTDGCIHDGWLVIGNIKTVFDQDFLYYALSSGFMFSTLSILAAGSTVKNLKSDTVRSVLFPIPPMEAQIRISQRLEKIINIVDSINADKKELAQIIRHTKLKILDLAIRGKLVPQDPDDEPASVLLERIRTEKEELIKQGKIKRDKKESIIFKGDDNSYYRKKGTHLICIDNELPYNLPDGWIWAMLPEVVFFQEGPGILKKDFRDKGVPLIRISGLKSDRVLLDGCNYLDQIMVENKWKHFKLEFGDVILCTSASIGKASIVGTEAVGAIPYTGQIRFKMTNALLREYFLYFANSDSYLSQINRMKTGNCIQHYGPTHLKEVYIPIPPIKEQKRMVVTIEHYFSQLNKISEVLA